MELASISNRSKSWIKAARKSGQTRIRISISLPSNAFSSTPSHADFGLLPRPHDPNKGVLTTFTPTHFAAAIKTLNAFGSRIIPMKARRWLEATITAFLLGLFIRNFGACPPYGR